MRVPSSRILPEKSQCGLTVTLGSPSNLVSTRALGESSGSRGMLFVAIYRKIVRVFVNRYRPELHYMRGPGPKWVERHGRSAGGSL
jgi:hypothetical protein